MRILCTVTKKTETEGKVTFLLTGDTASHQSVQASGLKIVVNKDSQDYNLLMHAFYNLKRVALEITVV